MIYVSFVYNFFLPLLLISPSQHSSVCLSGHSPDACWYIVISVAAGYMMTLRVLDIVPGVGRCGVCLHENAVTEFNGDIYWGRI